MRVRYRGGWESHIRRGAMKRLIGILFVACVMQLGYAVEVKTGIYLINMGNFNISDGSFTTDFYISFMNADKNKPMPQIDIEFLNGSMTSSYIVDDHPNRKVYRVKAALTIPVNLRKFPFEQHTLEMDIEDKTLSKEELTFIPDKFSSGVDKSIFVPGYRIKEWKIENSDHFYLVFNEKYSKIQFKMTIVKPILNAFLKTLLPVICMVIVVLLSFLFSKDMFENRITAITSGLLGVIMFHSSVASQLPPIGYLTFADKIFMISYLIIILSLLMNIVMDRVEKKNGVVAEKILSKTKYNIIIVYVLLIGIFCMMNMR
jgi:hypothetical protein